MAHSRQMPRKVSDPYDNHVLQFLFSPVLSIEELLVGLFARFGHLIPDTLSRSQWKESEFLVDRWLRGSPGSRRHLVNRYAAVPPASIAWTNQVQTQWFLVVPAADVGVRRLRRRV
jgi:hypothetical protein